MTDKYDVIVIGAGPAGYVAAIRCAQLGFDTACVDNWLDAAGKPQPGGTCLNAGCIPSKALLESSELFAKTRNGLSGHGIQVKGVTLDLDTMMKRKAGIVAELNTGIAGLFKANGVRWIPGTGKLINQSTVEVQEDKQTVQLQTDHIILATGSSPASLQQAPLNDELIVDSTGALSFSAVPKRLGVIGAGAIGLELASVWRRLGSEIVILEAQDSFLGMVDQQIATAAFRQLQKQGLDIRLGACVKGTQIENSAVRLDYEDGQGSHQEQVDKLIVAVGRSPNSDGLFDDASGLLIDEWGFVHVDDQCATNLPGVYAIGDLVRGPMLAHKGSEEGMMVAERIAGQATQVNYDLIPSVIYTQPEIAWSGDTEETLKSRGIDYRCGVFPFAASGRAKAMGETSGMVKILADAASDRVLGIHLLGPHCSELIAQAVIAMELGASSEDLAMTMFAHPTLSEAVHEAALAVDKRAIHIAPRKTRN